jgi:hypothetical protein
VYAFAAWELTLQLAAKTTSAVTKKFFIEDLFAGKPWRSMILRPAHAAPVSPARDLSA